MKNSLRLGMSFGWTSGIITTLGLMVGLNSGTHSRIVVLGGILTIAIADAFSDALGIHISEESEHKHTNKEIWESTIATFFAKLIIACTFLVPVLLFSLQTAIIVSIAWGLSLICLLSFYIAKKKSKRLEVILEHLGIAILVVILSNFVGKLITAYFG